MNFSVHRSHVNKVSVLSVSSSERRFGIMIPLSIEFPPEKSERSVVTGWQVRLRG